MEEGGEEHEVGVAWQHGDMCALASCSLKDGQMYVSYTT